MEGRNGERSTFVVFSTYRRNDAKTRRHDKEKGKTPKTCLVLAIHLLRCAMIFLYFRSYAPPVEEEKKDSMCFRVLLGGARHILSRVCIFPCFCDLPNVEEIR